MKAFLRFLVVAWLVCTLAGIAQAKVKPKNFGSVDQSQHSIAVDPAGFPHIAYQGVDGHLYHARFDGRTWQSELVDVSPYGGNSMAIDSQGHIHIVYSAYRVDGSTQAYSLVHAYYNGTIWQVTDLPVSGDNSDPKIVLDATGHPHVLFSSHVLYNYFTRYAVYDGADWHFEDTGFWGGTSPSLVLDADGNAHVSFGGGSYATNKSGTWETTLLATNNYGATAIGLDNAGNPHVVVGIGGALVCYSYDASGWKNETMVDFNGADQKLHALVWHKIAMTTDALGYAQVLLSVYLSYGNRQAVVSVFVFDDGVGWNGLLVDRKNTGLNPSIALDDDGVAYITYFGNGKAKWARVALPDLTGTCTNVSVAGTTVTGTLNVTNQGMAKSAKTTARLWLSDDATLDAGDTPLPVVLKVKSLTPGGTIAVPVRFQYDGTLAGKQLIAVLDPIMATTDRNLLDNTIVVPLGP